MFFMVVSQPEEGPGQGKEKEKDEFDMEE